MCMPPPTQRYVTSDSSVAPRASRLPSAHTHTRTHAHTHTRARAAQRRGARCSVSESHVSASPHQVGDCEIGHRSATHAAQLCAAWGRGWCGVPRMMQRCKWHGRRTVVSAGLSGGTAAANNCVEESARSPAGGEPPPWTTSLIIPAAWASNLAASRRAASALARMSRCRASRSWTGSMLLPSTAAITTASTVSISRSRAMGEPALRRPAALATS
jgi:hypothetical protein